MHTTNRCIAGIFSYDKIMGKEWPKVDQGTSGEAYEIRTIPTDVLLQLSQESEIEI